MNQKNWQGLPEEAFQPYQSWINQEGSLCGTYAAAVLIAYYQDYRQELVLPSFVRKQSSQESDNLVHYLRLLIQPLGYSTITVQVSHGLSRFTHYFQQPLWARSTPYGGWSRTVKRIDQGKPVIVGLNKWLGSHYGNHWVVAYAYCVDETGERWLKVHDNWGNYRAIIPAKWVMGTISFN